MTTINHGPRILDWVNIAEVEKKYDAKYVGEFVTKRPSGSWNEIPVAVFYVTNPDTSKGHTNYFGIFSHQGSVYITNAASVAEEPFEGVQVGDEIIYSRHRHDFRFDSTGTIFVDGGRDYLRWGGDDLSKGKVVRLQIIDGELKLLQVDHEHNDTRLEIHRAMNSALNPKPRPERLAYKPVEEKSVSERAFAIAAESDRLARKVADSKIKTAYVEHFGTEEGWLGVQGSYFIEGYKCGLNSRKDQK